MDGIAPEVMGEQTDGGEEGFHELKDRISFLACCLAEWRIDLAAGFLKLNPPSAERWWMSSLTTTRAFLVLGEYGFMNRDACSIPSRSSFPMSR
jgi:hypothetical protein